MNTLIIKKTRKKYTRKDNITLEERFWSKINKSDGCWEWNGVINNKGYGKFFYNGRMGYAHRFSFTLATGQNIDKLFVCHKCDNPKCVRPEHLFLGTQQENMTDMFTKGRNRNGKEGQTHCKNGHKLSDDNVLKFPSSKNRRICHTCQRERNTEFARAKRERVKFQNLIKSQETPAPK